VPERSRRCAGAPSPATASEGSEFETIGLLGPNCGVSDPDAIVAATAVCDAYGFDTMSAGIVASLAMECRERGIALPGGEDLDLRFGSGEGLIALMHQIGDGKAWATCWPRARCAPPRSSARRSWPCRARAWNATYEPRGVVGMGLTYAISPKGGHHMIAPTMGAEVAVIHAPASSRGKGPRW